MAAGGSLRVLIVTPDFPPTHGGIQTLMGRLARHLPDAGVAVRVVTLAAPGAREFDRRSDLDVRRSRALAAVPKARMAGLSAAAALQARRCRPHVVLAGHVAAFPAAAAINSLTGIPTVVYAHADEFRTSPRRCRFAMRRADAVIAVSRHAEQMALAAGAPQRRLHRISHGVDLPTEHRNGRDHTPPTIVTVARLVDHKGHDVMLQAMPLVLHRVQAARWVVIGDGPLRKDLEREAARLGVTKAVTFAGALPDAERDAWLHLAHVFAMPSRVPAGGRGGEGFGIAYLEAAAHGLPVIAGAEGGALDAVDGRCAALVDPRDHVALAGTISSLLEDSRRAHDMGRAALEWARRHSWPRTAAQVEQVLRAVAR